MNDALTPDRIEAAREYINSQILAAARKRAVNPDAVPSADVQALHCASAALEAVRGRDPAVELPNQNETVLVRVRDRTLPAKYFTNSCGVQKWVIAREISFNAPKIELLEKLPDTSYQAVDAWLPLPEWETLDSFAAELSIPPEIKKYRKKPVVIEAMQWDGKSLPVALRFCGKENLDISGKYPEK